MSSLKNYQLKIFETIFEMGGGYVLDFSNSSFSQFFSDYKINIYDDRYSVIGDSKANRLRAFIKIENDKLVGQVLSDLLEYTKTVNNTQIPEEAKNIINRLLGLEQEPKLSEEDQFLKKEFDKIDLSFIKDPSLSLILNERLNEIEITIKNKAPLSSIFLMGSILEGVLLELANNYPALFNKSKSSPKKQGETTPKPFYEWTLDNLINVSYEIGFIREDVKKHSLSLKDFRNYIHPRQQLLSKFTPDKHTVEISFKVLQASISQINQYLKNNSF